MQRRKFMTGLTAAGGLSLTGVTEGALTAAESSYWPHGRRKGFVTAYDHDVAMADLPRVWYTITAGAITEVRFPRLDLVNTTAIEFVVTDGDGYAVRTYDVDGTDGGTDADPVDRRATMVEDDALVFEQTITDDVTPDRDWTLTVEYIADRSGDALLADVAFDAASEYDLYVAADLALGHGTNADRANVAGSGESKRIVATGSSDGWIAKPDGSAYDVATALTAAGGFDWATADTAGGEIASLLSGTVPRTSSSASGNVQVAGRLLSGGGETTLAMGFAQDGDTEAATAAARDALSRGYESVREAYVSGWQSYLDATETPASVASDAALRAQYNASLMSLKAGESKHEQFRGASVAAPTIPWGQIEAADSAARTGYGHCWPRDLYHVFTALEAAGDVEAATHATEYLFEYQQKPDGSVKQNTTFDGTERWGTVQMDQVASPLIMAYQLLERHDIAPSDGDVSYDYRNVRLGADYVADNGPRTPQERWEENGGFSPQSIAAQIAGLVCAAELADHEGRAADADRWRRAADDFSSRLESVTVSDDGPFGDRYFVRVSPDDDPDGSSVTLANGGGTHPVNEVVDPSFLELVRFGVRSADDPVVLESLRVVDDRIRVDTPNGPGWYRYSHDGYGQEADGSPWDGTGVGRLWPFLTGERAEYELLADGTGDLSPTALLETMANFANEGRMVSEQVWDRSEATDYDWAFGEGTGAATPLLWCSAQFVRLAHCIDAGRPVETPSAVTDHFDTSPGGCPSLSVDAPDAVDADSATITGTTEADSVRIETSAGDVLEPTVGADGSFSADVALSIGDNTVTVSVPDADGDGRCEESVTVERRERLLHWSDPVGDDVGPGDYTYPTGSVFEDGDFDIVELAVRDRGSSYRFAVTMATEPTNPWEFDAGFAKQYLQFYVRDPSAAGGSTDAAPGVNATLASPYHVRILADGENGVRVQDATGDRLATGRATVEGSEIGIEVPKDAIGDLASASIAALVVGYDGTNSDYTRAVRPERSEWAFGGAANDNAPQVLDVITPPDVSQSAALAYTSESRASIPLRPVSDGSGDPAAFDVSSLEHPSSATIGDEITVTATVTNTGDAGGTATIEFGVDGTIAESTDVTLSPSSSSSVSFEYDTSGLSAGSHTITVGSGTDTASGSIEVSTGNGSANAFEVRNVDSPSSAAVGDRIYASADIVNTGDELTTKTVEFLVDGTHRDEMAVDLHENSQRWIQFDLDTAGMATGEHAVTIATPDDRASRTVTLTDSP
ncbi:glucodextranase DOMON-like domain-containing protein [Natrinema salsiterrestre]|uniref:Glycoside hydrolase family 15 protein n=1 Tax=Natrinema salsiterrestre TaxID=2950540 RepID=A0A9Q4PZZ0_9EURY|nr:glucodextranase DOMON-like domain-containing protein [Natrinema salsiterrestre]MDF9745064.1 glycoside hydrolase family 15 protein [Natrinema salsiterrestre]